MRYFVASLIGIVLIQPSLGFGKTLHVRMAEAPATLDWNNLASTNEAPIINNISEGLFSFEYPSKKLVPGLAESVTKSKDLTHYTFKIKEGAKWSDGRPVYAQDFVTGWSRTLSPKGSCTYNYYLFDIKNAEKYFRNQLKDNESLGVKALSDRVLEVEFSHPVKDWEVLTAFWPLFPTRQDQLEKYGNNWWRPGVIVTTGPFSVENYEPGKKMNLVRNPYYKAFHSNVDRVEISFVINHDEALKKYEDKQFDFLNNLPFRLQQTLSKRTDFHLGGLLQIHYLIANTDKFPMNNREFRLAVMSAVDVSKLIPPVKLQFEAAQSMVPKPLLGSSEFTGVPFSRESAKAHLKKSGIVVGKAFKLSMVTFVAEPFLSVGNEIRAQVEKNLGINVEISALENVDYTAYMSLSDYHLTHHTWSPKVFTPEDILLRYSSIPSVSRSHYKNLTYNELIAIGSAAQTHSEKESAFLKAERLISAEEGVINTLFFEINTYLMPKTTQEVYFDGVGAFVLKNAMI